MRTRWLAVTRPVFERQSAMRPAVVYRHFAADGALLYVGSTVSLPKRDAHHRAHSPWFVDGVTTEAVVCGCLRVAREVELEAILTEFPRWNVADRAKDHPDGWARTHWDVAQIYPGTYRAEHVALPTPRHRAVPA